MEWRQETEWAKALMNHARVTETVPEEWEGVRISVRRQNVLHCMGHLPFHAFKLYASVLLCLHGSMLLPFCTFRKGLSSSTYVDASPNIHFIFGPCAQAKTLKMKYERKADYQVHRMNHTSTAQKRNL
jgi:hypothetical protein